MSGDTTAAVVLGQQGRRGYHGRSRGRFGALGFGLPAAVLLVALALYPMVVLFRMSFSDVGPSNIIGEWDWVGGANFAATLQDPSFWDALWRTLLLSAILLVSNLLLGFIAATILASSGRLTAITLSIMVFVWALPALVSGSVWKFMLDDSGSVNAVLGALGLGAVPWLSSPTLALWSVAGVIAWSALPFSALILRGGLLAISADVLEAAAIDGAGFWRTQARIVMPLLRPTMWILGILTLINSFKTFDFFYVMTSGGPGTATNTLPVMAYLQAFSAFDMSTGATVAVLSMIIVVAFAVPYVRGIQKEEDE
ncbi:carbohydrate ABC transporter permease [Microbacterium sp. CIAB417]|uniref:carbohydrate ABC transporter permease n=1 Tax=Microbacterium sp. CIAB417 TaxID=2860287 RepID=UPI001FABA4DE|nr:sugar ABC transporter permease [Microbacterium sp. CIAB417]